MEFEHRMQKEKINKGAVLVVVVSIVLVLTLLGLGVLSLARSEAVVTQHEQTQGVLPGRVRHRSTEH